MWSKPKKGKVFVVSAPSGAGKTTLTKKLLDDPSLNLRYSVSFTTREPRKGERNGRDYHFASEKVFLRKIARGDFLEYACVYGHFYGTDRRIVGHLQDSGSNVLIDVDTQGARSLQKRRGFRAVYIFILPPSLKELRERLVNRKRDDKKEIRKRFFEAKKEIWRARRYDYCVVNADIRQAVADIRNIIRAELLKTEQYRFRSV
jgi:guanylate kinase